MNKTSGADGVRRQKKSFYYGWVISFAGILITGIGVGVFSLTNSAFVIPVSEALGISRGSFTVHSTFISVSRLLMVPVFARWVKRFGAKRMMLLSTLGLLAVFWGYSIASQTWHFYLLSTLNGLVSNGVNFMVVGLLISQWFDEKRGLATGIAYCGSGLGGAAALPLTQKLIGSYGWRIGYRAVSAGAAAILLPVILLLIVDRPRERDLPRPGESRESVRHPASSELEGLSRREAMRTPAFWIMAAVFFTTSVIACGPSIHGVSHLRDVGYPAQQASAIWSFSLIVMTVVKILLGIVYDKLGSKTGNLIVGISCLAMPILALQSKHLAAAYGFAAMYGFASSGYTVPVSTLVGRQFGKKEFASLFSFFTMTTNIGAILSVPIMGWIFDGTGSYTAAWYLLLACGGITLLGYLILNRSKGYMKEPKGETT